MNCETSRLEGEFFAFTQTNARNSRGAFGIIANGWIRQRSGGVGHGRQF